MVQRRLLALTALVALLATDVAKADAPIVFVSRYMGASPDVSRRTTAIERALSGRLRIREADGTLRELVDGALPDATDDIPIDVTDPDVSYDGQRVVFAGFSKKEGAWRIFEINVDGTGLRQITRSDRNLDLSRFGAAASELEGYDDVDPVYLPDGRIVYVSTRYPQVAPDGRRRATNLYVVNVDGSDNHRITTERFGADTPSIDPTTGKIVYSRWWRSTMFDNSADLRGRDDDDIVPVGSPGYGGVNPPPTNGNPVSSVREVSDEDFPGLNSWFFASCSPDGTEMTMFNGVGLDREATQAHRPSFLPNGDALGLFIPRTPILGLPRGDGLRLVPPGPIVPQDLGGPQTFDQNNSFDFVYASAEVLDNESLIVTAAHRSQPNDYDLYLQGQDGGSPVLLLQIPGTSEVHATPVVARELPPVIADKYTGRRSDVIPRTVSEAFEQNGKFTFRVDNIFLNAPVDDPTATAPPMGQGLRIQFWTNFQRTGVATADEPILIAEKEIPPSGAVEVELPANIPLFEVLRTTSGDIGMGRDGQIFHVGGLNFGTEANRKDSGSCVGCHAGHSMQSVPHDFTWGNVAPSADLKPSTTRTIMLGNRTRRFLRAENLVDRKTDPVEGEWASQRRDGSVNLSWGFEVEARSMVLYGTKSGNGINGPRDLRVNHVNITTRLGGVEQERIEVRRTIAEGGTTVSLNPSLRFDSMNISIPAAGVSGEFEGQRTAALAEVEVIGRAAGVTSGPSFSRGDTNCDGDHNLSDAVAVLNHLFTGQADLCCQVAADVDGDETVQLTDAVYLLNFLFQGGAQPASPYPECATAPVGALECEQSACE